METKINTITLNTVLGSVLWASTKTTTAEAVAEKYKRDADLRDADLRDANLRDADLYGANLYGADEKTLPKEYINQCSRDILFILGCLKTEVPALKQMLIAGKVDGTQYEGKCACLLGSLANADGGMEKICAAIPFYSKGTHNAGEAFFLNIKKGDTPKTNWFSRHAVELCDMVLAQK